VSYWVFKRRFGLHDDDIAGLKDELITAGRLAVDTEVCLHQARTIARRQQVKSL